MITFLVILFFVAAFLVGQVTLLRPSLRDTRLMELRAQARAAGLHPRLLPPPEWYRGQRPPGGLLACYSRIIEDEGRGRGLPYFRAERLDDGEWVVRVGERSVLAALSLPAEATALTAIEAQAHTASLWWQESLGPEAVPALSALTREVLDKIK